MAINENMELEHLIHNATGGGTSLELPLTGGNETEEDAPSFDSATLVLVARRSLLWVILLITLGVTASWLYLRYTKPIYKSQSLLKIDERNQGSALGFASPAADMNRTSKLAGEIELIKSNIIYRKLKDSLALDVNYYVQGTVLETELFGKSPFRVKHTVTDRSLYNSNFDLKFITPTRFSLDFTGKGQPQRGEFTFGQVIKWPGITLQVFGTSEITNKTPQENYHFEILNDSQINAYLNKNLAVDIVNLDANTIQISFNDFTPNKAQDIVNQIDSLYLS